MAEPSQAVFLSYASQDADAARRIGEALRAAGVEVWLDQSELRGGDAWDHKIRQQIKDCALFVPVISANTVSRVEGYFRLEWALAEQRSQMIARNKAFIVPVCLDSMPHSGDVPESFLRAQWTRLPGGEGAAQFAQRLRELLSQDPGRTVPAATDAVARPTPAAAPARAPGVARLLIAAAVLGAGYIAVDKLRNRPATLPANGAVPAAQAPKSAVAAPDKSVAVLPFADLSPNKDQEYFSDGLSEELIDLLSKVRELQVPTRTSSFYFKGKQATLPEIARTLRVANVLEGSVRKSGDQLRISVELVRAADESRLWSETYDRKLDDIFKVQDGIADAVVKALKISLLTGQPANAPTVNTEAYTLYLQARAIQHLGSPADFSKATSYYQRVVALDPGFAAAWAALAGILADDYATFRAHSYDSVRVAAHAAADHALALNPDSAEVQLEVGRVAYLVDLDWSTAKRAFARASEIDPGNSIALRFQAYLAGTLGQSAEQQHFASAAIARDPLDYWNFYALGLAHYCDGRFDLAADAMRKGLELNPGGSGPRADYARILLVSGHADEALQEIQKEISPNWRDLTLPLIWDALGRKAEADTALARAEALYGDKQAYRVALIYAARHDLDRAFQWLDRSYRQHDDTPVFMRHDPLLKGLEGDPRFAAFLGKMNIPQ